VSKPYWQAKIWGLLHDPTLKALYPCRQMGEEGAWSILDCMEGWVSPKDSQQMGQSELNGTWLKYIGLCDLIASASDRSTIGRLPAEYSAVEYSQTEGIKIHHLLSGEPYALQLGEENQQRLSERGRVQWLTKIQEDSLNLIKDCREPRKVYWWLWRCYGEVIADNLKESIISLLPAETRLPDGSLWSHVTMTSALAGGLAGYYVNAEDYPEKGQSFNRSRPHLVIFSFSPVQELIKASRKMRDFWAGSWLLHYLSARVCYSLARKYGPDIFLYPCLYQQPLIDHWLLQDNQDDPAFTKTIKSPELNKLLTAGFPNVLVLILPNNGEPPENSKLIQGVMTFAQNSLREEWRRISELVLRYIQKQNQAKKWQKVNQATWQSWLEGQWEIYWSAIPFGHLEEELAKSPRKTEEYEQWKTAQNQFTHSESRLFPEDEEEFLKVIYNLTTPADAEDDENSSETTTQKSKNYKQPPNMNVGSWWASIFDNLRFSLNSVKNARDWQLPTVFSARSTVSGLGSAVHNHETDWVGEKQLREFWEITLNLFDGSEQLNATEVVKRCLHHILGELLNLKTEERLDLYYPDLSSGVAGYLKQNSDVQLRYKRACQKIIEQFPWAKESSKNQWGIPYIDRQNNSIAHPRLLNSGWLIEDYNQENKQEKLQQLKNAIDVLYPENNPTDWYVIAAGDGDGMSDWLKGTKLKEYEAYIPKALHQKIETMPSAYKAPLERFIKRQKRMSPASHNALSRALLDFSNQLVPYLTEQRYAGRLIYGGGDDVLAYTNLWEWNQWLWDLRCCFQGEKDPKDEFINQGNYWQWNQENNPDIPEEITDRPLFTMGGNATISFGVVIVHQSVPLAIALENLWEAEDEAKKHNYFQEGNKEKDAVQVRVLYSNGNILKATAKFDTFNQWQQLLKIPKLEAAIFEQATNLWESHPIPVETAIEPWVKVFCSRREQLTGVNQQQFQESLRIFLNTLWQTTSEKEIEQQVKNWLKVTAFLLRKRQIQ
jgi:CRISPR-associated protein Cmr2